VPPGLNNIQSVHCGGSHNVALTIDELVVAWGSNKYGQCDINIGNIYN
jgi:alpha-tubulin suppressor-like RCC1 family protein